MPSITTWNRLEPLAVGDDFETGLQARVHDPLWMLARQWQFGELRAEDRGSPVEARVEYSSSPVTRFRPGESGPAVHYNPQASPLEPLVEAEPNSPVSLLQAARAGLRFLRQLRADQRLSSYVGRVLRAHGFANQPESDPMVAQFLAQVQGRAPDGRRLHATYRDAFLADGGLSDARLEILIDERDDAAFRAALADWMRRHFSMFEGRRETASSWMARRMEYRFALAAQCPHDEVVLEAEEYRGGRLDWHSFRQSGQSLSSQPGDLSGRSPTIQRRRRLLPVPVDFPGMPMPRWWQFEDRRIDLGNVSAGTFDLARMLLIEFALSYGNDWFLIPLDLEVGSWSRISSLTIRDAFGEEFEIGPVAAASGEGQWQMFVISGFKPGEGLFLPPVLAGSLVGKPLEEVRLAKDEMANCAWAIEEAVENALGNVIQRAEEGPGRPLPPPATETPLKYRLGSTVPAHWFPLVPAPETPGGRSIRLRLARIGSDEGAADPKGRILRELAATSPPSLFEEEVPRAGAVVTRIPQLARWMDGSTHVWTGREKRPGRGEASSGLRFDIVE